MFTAVLVTLRSWMVGMGLESPEGAGKTNQDKISAQSQSSTVTPSCGGGEKNCVFIQDLLSKHYPGCQAEIPNGSTNSKQRNLIHISHPHTKLVTHRGRDMMCLDHPDTSSNSMKHSLRWTQVKKTLKGARAPCQKRQSHNPRNSQNLKSGGW